MVDTRLIMTSGYMNVWLYGCGNAFLVYLLHVVSFDTIYSCRLLIYLAFSWKKKGFHFSSLTEYISLWLLRTIIFEQGAYLSDRQNWEFWMIVKYKIKSLYLTFHTLSWWVQAVIMMAKLYSPTKFHGNRTQFELPAPVFDCESRPQVF